MRTRTLSLGLVLLATRGLAAQQTPGVISNPLVSPVYPGIVAFERIASDQQEIQFLRVSNNSVLPMTRTKAKTQGGTVVQLPDVGSATRLSAYAGQLDWRPIDDRGRSWFAYVASDDKGKVGLWLNYVDQSGQVEKDPIRIPFEGQARAPRWSLPDGKHLAFVSDSSVLYIVSDVDAALKSGSGAALKPTRITTASRPALFPAWSPFGDHLAYGVEVVSRGTRNGAIEVIPINKLSGKVAGPPVNVTSELIADNEFRPSWSPDSRYIAFYADQAGVVGNKQQVAIGITEVILNSRDGKVFRGAFKEGATRWVADNVIPDEQRGPAWTSLAEGAANNDPDARQKGLIKDGLLYVLRDAARHNPIVVAGTQRFLQSLTRDQYEADIGASWGAANPKSVSSLEMKFKMRFAYTSVLGGGDVVGTKDAVAMWAKGPEPEGSGPVRVIADKGGEKSVPSASDVPTVIYAHKGQNVSAAVLFPGFGQFSAGSTGKGAALTVGGLAGVALAFLGKSGVSSAIDSATAAIKLVGTGAEADARPKYLRAQDQFGSSKQLLEAGLAIYVASWLYGIQDVGLGDPARQSNAFRVTPSRSESGGLSAQVGFSIPFGSSHH